MTRKSREKSGCRFSRLIAWGIIFLIAGSVTAPAQEGHPLYPAGLPTGYVGQGALLQPLPMQGYYQPVKIIPPEGTIVSFALQDDFVPKAAPAQVGLLVGHVYRFRMTEIPYNEGTELYPTLEIINRLYSPQGKENDFPVEIEITQEDLEIALNGHLVTRVVYLEDPLTALPTKGEDKTVLTQNLEPTQNPLHAAEQYGRPMAILRMGNRQPLPGEHDPAFFFGMPPWQDAVVVAQPVQQVHPVIIEAQSGMRTVR